MRVKEWQGDVVFLHEVVLVRRIGLTAFMWRASGLPAPVILRAEQVPETLERGEQSGAITRLAEDRHSLQTLRRPPPAVQDRRRRKALRDLNPDDLTPREALDALYRLRTLISD